MRNKFAEKLFSSALLDKKILLLTGDLGYGVLDEFATKLPDQYLNVGVTEQSMMSMAAGLASKGFRPFVYSIANFPTLRCLEQIRNDVSYMNNPVTIVAVGAGLSYGNLGYTHHAIEDISIMRSFPNIAIYNPASPFEVEACVEDILSNESPAYLRLGKGGEKEMHKTKDLNVSEPILLNQGNEGFIVSTGALTFMVMEVLQRLQAFGINPTVYSIPKITKHSVKLLLGIVQDSYLLTIEEHILSGGFGSWILEEANLGKSSVKISRIGINNSFTERFGDQNYMLNQFQITPEYSVDSFLKLRESSKSD